MMGIFLNVEKQLTRLKYLTVCGTEVSMLFVDRTKGKHCILELLAAEEFARHLVH